MMKKDNQVTVKLDPIADTLNKNNGVKKSIAKVY